MFKQLRNSYHNASEWVHHHSAVAIFGLTLVAAMFGRQFGSNFMGNQQTYAFEADPHGWCNTNSGAIAIPQTECLFLADIYTGNNGGNWQNIWENPWFTSTDIESRQSIGLEGGNNITRFEGLGDNINTNQTLDFSPLTQLTYLDLSNATVGGLYIADNTLLNVLFVNNISGITSIDLSPFPNLTYFHWNLWGSSWTLQSAPDFSNNINLVNLSLNGHGLPTLDLSMLSALEHLSVGWNQLNESTLLLPATNTLNNIQINNNNFTSFDTTPYTNLQSMYAYDNNIASFVIPDNSSIKSLYLQNNLLTNINLANQSNITDINLADNNITLLDIGNNTGIYYIDLQNNGLQTLTNFGNIQGFNEWNNLENNINGNCLDPEQIELEDPAAFSLLNTYFSAWSQNQTCGVFSCSLVTDIPQSECEMLVTLYEELDGDNWDDNWLQGNTICGNRDHVGCTYDYGQPRVNGLWLSSASGTVPPIDNLPYLETLNIGTRDWDSLYSVTLDLGALSNLSLVDLNATNTILQGSLDNLSNSYNTMQYLSLNGNDAQEFYYTPAQLANFSELIQVDMSNLIIEGDIAPLANLENLEILSLNCRGSSDDCAAYGDLSVVSGLTNLRELRLDSIGYLGSGTNSLLSDIQNMTNLEYIALGGNDLEGELGSWIGNFQQLTNLELNDNMLSGELPAALGQLTQLEVLQLGENFFSGPLPELVGFNNLIELELQRNNFVGTIPTTRGNLTTIERIGLGGRSFDNDMLLEGTLPDWSNLTNLSRIEIMFTNLEGNIPAYRGDLPLDHIAVFYNKFTGEIPTNRQNLASLVVMDRLWLNNNHLEGDIPSWIVDLDYDQSLKIESNCLNTASVASGSQLELDLDDATNGTWRSQTNCLSDIQISKRLGQDSVNAGDIIDLYIDYENIGSQKAIKVDIAEVLDPSLSILEVGSDPHTFGNIRYSYFNNNDMCYTDLLYNATGVYYSHINNILTSYLSDDVGDLPGLGYVIEQGFFGFDLEDLRLGLNEPLLSSEGAGVIFFCAFANGGMDQSAIVEAYNTLGSVCLPNAFAMKGRDFKPQGCGYSTEQGYIWNIGDIPAGGTGTIHIKLQVADPLLPEQQLGLRTYLEMDGVNASTNELSFAIEGSQVVLLDGNEEDDSGDEGEGSGDPTPPAQPSIGGGPSGGNNPPSIQQDDCSDYIPPIDQSSSYYDADCEPDHAEDDENDEEEEAEHESANEDEIFDLEKVIPSTSEIIEEMKNLSPNTIASTEEVKAYMFAKYVGITTKDSFEEADPQGVILRGDFAKMIINFAENVLGYQANNNRREVCSNYSDTYLVEGTDLEEYITRACMHRIMGLDTDAFTPMESFNPFEVMNRAMIVTTISRMIDQGKTAELYEPNENYRTAHMASLLEKGVITVADPTLIDKRINAFIMLMRQTQDIMEDK